jgi:quercetin dioxygenase-like cupin family protein
MNEFPEFMKSPLNRVSSKSQFTPGIEGYVFDGADGSQMAFWTYGQEARSEKHVHEYDEYVAVVQGQYVIHIEEQRIPLTPGDEYVIPKGISHAGEAVAGTRAIYAFGGSRAKRETEE